MRSGQRLFQAAAVGLTAFWLLATLWAMLGRTDGLLVYALDDPYIHLSVAETLLNGGYGVNVGEYASPSSSIIYPFLLAGALALGLGEWGPLVLNALAALAAAWIIAGVFWVSTTDPAARGSAFAAWLCLPVLLLAPSLIALPMTGMEHTLHVLASICVIVGIRGLDDGRPPSVLLVAGILFAPLLRFEGLALAGAALAALLITRRVGTFAALTLALVAVYAVYMGFMSRLGLPLLPSSVLTKSGVTEAAVDGHTLSAITGMISGVVGALNNRQGLILTVTLGLLMFAAASSGTSRKTPLLVIGVASAAIGAHLAVGQYGWFGRYEVYVIAVAVTASLYAWAGALRAPAARPWLRTAAVLGLLGVVSLPYGIVLLRTPAASENTYAQQYQMHRFATAFFAQPVAVNDLGYVSYRNDTHVLDLWGLGSEEARLMNADAGRNAQSVAALTEGAGSAYAMIYDIWFEEAVPADWCRIATLRTPQVAAASDEVAFYLIDRRLEDEMQAALAAFAPTLPAVATLDRFDCTP